MMTYGERCVTLGETYRRAGRELDERGLRAFLLARGESLLHFGHSGDEGEADSLVIATVQLLEDLLRTAPPDRRRRAVDHLRELGIARITYPGRRSEDMGAQPG